MLVKLVLFFIALYRKFWVFKPRACRFYPSCSAYSEEAIKKYGIRGIFMSITRILRCNPFIQGGYDPVK